MNSQIPYLNANADLQGSKCPPLSAQQQQPQQPGAGAMVMYGANLQYGQNPYGQQYGQQQGYGYGYQQPGYAPQGYGMGAPVQPGALVPYGLSPQGAVSCVIAFTMTCWSSQRACQ